MATLFIEADEPLLVFASVEMAEQHLEAVDVREGIYKRAYGPSGEPFSIAIEGEGVVIRPIGQPADPDGLLELLRRSLHAVGATAPPDADLSTLVATTVAVWTKRQRYVEVVSWWSCMAVMIVLGGLAAFIWA